MSKDAPINANVDSFTKLTRSAVIGENRQRVMVWIDRESDSSVIKARIATPDGMSVTSDDIVVGVLRNGGKGRASIADLAGGRFFITWTDQDVAGGWALHGRILDEAANFIGDEIILDESALQRNHFVLALPGGSQLDIRAVGQSSSDNVLADFFERESSAETSSPAPSFLPSVSISAVETRSNELSDMTRETLVGQLAVTTWTGTAGADVYTGTDQDEIINGAAGNDQLSGMGGNDTISGGIGDDTLNGGIGDDFLDGEGGLNRLDGGGGNDTLVGGGSDVLMGGQGDDVYIINSSTVTIFEAPNEGKDKIVTSVSFTLTGGMSVETLEAAAGAENVNLTGGDGNDVLIGNDGSNWLDGGAGNDTLIGGDGYNSFKGGLGADSLVGGRGTDIFYIDDDQDTVSDAGGNDDAIYVTISYKLAAGLGIEILSVRTNAPERPYQLEGNELDNKIIGGAANDTLIGGAGNDTLIGSYMGAPISADLMIGGAGNDTYIVDHVGDVVREVSATDGIDTVQTSVDFTLGAFVENMTATKNANIRLTGNQLSNVLIGNSGNNTLDGAGGGDVLKGGAGDDTYIVHSAIDIVEENANEGNDTIIAATSYKLSEGSSVETLRAMSARAGLLLVGNSGNNVLIANDLGSVLDGGKGADTMVGGLGDDTYYIRDLTDVVMQDTGGTDTAHMYRGLYSSAAELDAAIEALRSKGIENFIIHDGNGVPGAGDPNPGSPNTAPSDIILSRTSIDENTPGGSRVGNLNATDAQGGVFAYRIVSDPDEKFEIVIVDGAAQLRLRPGASLDYETKTSHEVRVRVTDSGGLTYEKTFVIAVNNLAEDGGNTAPTDIVLSRSAIDENSPGGSFVAELSANDAQGGPLNYSIVSDPNSKFQIVVVDGVVQLRLRPGATLDYETGTSHAVRIKVTDSGNLSYEKDFVIAVNDLPEDTPNTAPADILLSQTAIDENSAGGALIGELSTVDAEQGPFEYTIVSDTDSKFQIVVVNGVVQLRLREGATLDYEAKTSHTVRIKVTDSGDLSYEKDFAITVNDLSESGGNTAPSDIALSHAAIDENSAGGSLIGELTATDAQGGPMNFKISGDPDSKFQIVVINGVVQLRLRDGASLDFETKSSHQVTISVTDSDGLSYEKTFAITVNDIAEDGPNTAPTDISLSNSAIDENSAGGSLIGELGASDAQGGPLVYSIAEDGDSKFQIVTIGGVAQLRLRAGAALDYETKSSHDVKIRVTDSGGLSYEKTFVIAVNNLSEGGGNTAPTDISLSQMSIDENAASGKFIGELRATDLEQGPFVYKIRLADGALADTDGRFRIVHHVDGTWQLQVNDSSLLDYETNAFHDIAIVVTDDHGASYVKTFRISVNDLPEQNENHAPINLTISGASVREASVNNAPIGTLSATDVDGDTLTYTLLGDEANAVFYIDATTNQLKLKDGLKIDFEQKREWVLSIQVSDGKGGVLVQDMTISVRNTFTDNVTGLGNDDKIVGGAQGDRINGGAGNDTINGGAGNDTLTGGTGSDVFEFNQNPLSAHKDKIVDFNVEEGDRICFVKTPVAFTALGSAGVLSAEAFWVGSAAHDADDRIIYDSVEGRLLYDADGSGAGAAREIATLSKNLVLTHANFFIV